MGMITLDLAYVRGIKAGLMRAKALFNTENFTRIDIEINTTRTIPSSFELLILVNLASLFVTQKMIHSFWCCFF